MGKEGSKNNKKNEDIRITDTIYTTIGAHWMLEETERDAASLAEATKITTTTTATATQTATICQNTVYIKLQKTTSSVTTGSLLFKTADNRGQLKRT